MIKKLSVAIFVLLAIFYGLFFVKSNVDNEFSLKLTEDTSFDYVLATLRKEKVIKNRYIFDMFLMAYQIKSVPAGYYKIGLKMNSLDILRKLKYGRQDPIRFTLSTATFITDIAKKVGEKMKFDSAVFMNTLMTSQNMTKYEYNSENVMTKFLPNTYEFYWTMTPDEFIEKWIESSDEYWAQKKSNLAKVNLNPSQAYIMATLVQKEYSKKNERSKIAQVFFNRMKINMPLQVDATCKYATRDFASKRVTNVHTSYPSPYNTYLNQGLPPGPICVPELETIEAVLNPENHDYIYYCADPSLNGYHIFTKTYAEHELVAKKYAQKMNELKIR